MNDPARSCKCNSAVFVKRTTPCSSWATDFQAGSILHGYLVITLIPQRFGAQKGVVSVGTVKKSMAAIASR
jgi:hypothetical protein